MVIILWFSIYGKYFFGAVLLALFFELYRTLQQARKERKEETDFKEITEESTRSLVYKENNKNR